MIALLLVAATTKSGSSSFLLPVMLVGFALIYFFVLRPRQRKMKEQQAQTRKASVGDTIETIGGVRGVVLSEDEKYIVIATGGLPGESVPQPTTLTFLKQAIARKVEDEVDAEPEASTQATPPSAPAVENPVAELEADGSPEGEDDKK